MIKFDHRKRRFSSNEPACTSVWGFHAGWNKDTFLVGNSNVADKNIYSAQPDQ